MNPYEMFGTDNRAETDGVWLDFGSFKIRIARAGGSNKRFQQALEAKRRPHLRKIEAEALDPDFAERLLAEAYAETIVLGWEGVSGRDGKPLKFTRENVVALLTDLPDLFMEIRVQANRLANFRAVEVEEAKGN